MRSIGLRGKPISVVGRLGLTWLAGAARTCLGCIPIPSPAPGRHGSIAALDRPFQTPHEMDQAMMDAWYELVGAGDTIIYLGDVGVDGNVQVHHQRWWQQAPGAKWLVIGNHDVDPVNQVRPIEVDRTALTEDRAGGGNGDELQRRLLAQPERQVSENHVVSSQRAGAELAGPAPSPASREQPPWNRSRPPATSRSVPAPTRRRPAPPCILCGGGDP